MNKAEYCKTLPDGNIQCELCPHGCVLKEGQTGLCRIRRVIEGDLIATAYGSISSASLDPIEKKPLNLFHSGSDIFSIGSWGCNLACSFCQNWSISQRHNESADLYSPIEIAESASKNESIGIAYTYNEPLINIEFVKDCAEIIKSRGMVNVLVTNGYINPEPASTLLPFIDALNIDIKSMTESFYVSECKAKLQPVLDFAIQAFKQGCHLEITNLVIPGKNDQDSEFKELSEWIRNNLSQDTALHLNAYHPEYKMAIPGTSLETLEKAYDICSEDLNNVFLGNVRTR